ncbi:hypothetical protein [Alkalinema sp. FACHB-956]|uniref:tetratricopeptide repeat protein n=1 Tax=Alkalinema sp. FACHB-956 TaxID=2692768 RepID=UPI0016885947|nr:hypothetical protein [Alkalinema sp. FACHB-956]MBD2327439.1 hypothetical protein [Alkalinema sp. FACHB-956]
MQGGIPRGVTSGLAGIALGLFAIALPSSAQLPTRVLGPQIKTPPKTQASPPKPQEDRFPPNPLEIQEPDPLLPKGKQPLSAAERDRLRTALDALSLQGMAKLQEGKPQEAFDLWNRELRLRRALGYREEVIALGRVGETAWQQSQTQEVRYISQRLQQIQAEIQKPPIPTDRAELIELLGLAYQLIRSPDLALSVYEPKLAQARQRKNALEEFNALNEIGLLHLNWFRYPNAAQTYRDLLAIARQNQDLTSEVLYLIQLTYVHEQAKQPEQAVPYLEALLQIYQDQPEVLPALTLRLAENYDAAKNVEKAEQNYQAAYTLSQAITQSSYGGDALQKLGLLYRRHDRIDAAVQVYDFLVDYGQTINDLYLSMNAADQLGQLRLLQKDTQGAIAAFQQGLQFAQVLQLRPEYFTQRIEKAQKPSNSQGQPLDSPSSGPKVAPQIAPQVAPQVAPTPMPPAIEGKPKAS